MDSNYNLAQMARAEEIKRGRTTEIDNIVSNRKAVASKDIFVQVVGPGRVT